MKKLTKKLSAMLMAVAVMVGMLVPTGMTTFAAESNEVELKATKVLEGGTLEDQQFTFKIEAKTEGAPMPATTEAKNDADGNVSFGNVKFTRDGTYEYTVTEVAGDDKNITYDTEAKTITVTVSEDKSSSSGGFTPTVHVDEGKAMQWLKSYSAEGEEVDYSKGDEISGAATYKVVTDGDDIFHPFCTVEEVSSSDSQAPVGAPTRVRYRSNAGQGAGGTYLDSVIQVQKDNRKNAGWTEKDLEKIPTIEQAHVGLQMLFYAGYPYNQANLKGDMSDKEYYGVCQWALWGFLHGAKSGDDVTQRSQSGNEGVYDALLDYAWGGNGTNDLWLPESGIVMYVYWPNSGAPDDYQTLINAYLETEVAETVLTAEATTVEFKNKKEEPETESTTEPETESTTEPETESTTEPETESTTEPSKEPGEIHTTVKANDSKATASAAARLKFAETKTFVMVEDAIDYDGLVKGATYTVTGTLVEIDKDGKIIDDSVATATEEKVAEDTKGTWSLDFGGVTLKPYAKYVVFEEAYTAGGEDENATVEEPLEHKDTKDIAQTILTEDENGRVLDDEEEPDITTTTKKVEKTTTKAASTTKKSTSGKSPKTGDEANTTLWIVLVIAAAAVATGTVIARRRKRDNVQ